MPKLKKKPGNQREVVYEEVVHELCQGMTAITPDDAMQLLGWEEVTDGKYAGEVFALTGKKAVLKNNITNRPIYANLVRTYKQEILRKRWCGPSGNERTVNGEPIIVGRTGLILNGQHQLIALIAAYLDWEADKEKWLEYWPDRPVIDKVVVSGIDEDDDTVNTMDTCKPRSLYDVLCRSKYFSGLKPHEQHKYARMADHAIRLMWHRTGAGLDAFAPRRTHSESIAFLDAHPKIIECVKHVYEEDGDDGKIARYCSPGYTAGLLYLMGSSKSEPEPYGKAQHPDESLLTWDNWDKATNFIVLLAAGSKETEAVRSVLSSLLEHGNVSMAERWGIITLAWLAYEAGQKIVPEDLQLEHQVDDDGNRKLLDHPSVGGIDLGDPSTADEAVIAKTDDPDPTQIEERKAEVHAKAERKVPEKAKTPHLVPHKAGPNWAKGDVAWVRDPDNEHYLGELTEDPWDCDIGDCRATVRDSKGDEWEVIYEDLSLEKPKDSQKPAPNLPKAAAPKKANAQKPWNVGDRAWVREADGNHWRGKIIELSKGGAKLKVDNGHQGAGNVQMAWFKQMSKDQPV